MQIIGKLISVVGAIGVVGGSIVTINYLNKGFRNVNDRLKGAGFAVLDINSDDSEWAKVELAYKQEQTSSKKFTGNLTTAKENCKIVLEKGPDHSLYKLASKWCVKEEKMEEMLKRNKYNKLTKEQSNKQLWVEKINNLKRYLGEDKIVINFNEGNEDGRITKLQAECEKIIAEGIKTHSDDEFEKKFFQAKVWCANKEVN